LLVVGRSALEVRAPAAEAFGLKLEVRTLNNESRKESFLDSTFSVLTSNFGLF
jgi:hypothetical protein